MSTLKPWTNAPFDLILHAEMHQLKEDDFDRRFAFISFDNSIEVSITTYLELHPIQRDGYKIKKKWREDYPSKIDFLEFWLIEHKLPIEVEKEVIHWYHKIRNTQYHDGSKGVPEVRDILEIRKIALWVFSLLFDVPDIEQKLEERIAEINPIKAKYEKDSEINKKIDQIYGTVEVAGNIYLTSELLFAADPIAYQDIVSTLNDINLPLNDKEKEHLE
jgi:hypothetical protein